MAIKLQIRRSGKGYVSTMNLSLSLSLLTGLCIVNTVAYKTYKSIIMDAPCDDVRAWCLCAQVRPKGGLGRASDGFSTVRVKIACVSVPQHRKTCNATVARHAYYHTWSKTNYQPAIIGILSVCDKKGGGLKGQNDSTCQSVERFLPMTILKIPIISTNINLALNWWPEIIPMLVKKCMQNK